VQLLGTIVFVIGVLLLIGAARAFRGTRSFIARCQTTDGRVTGYTTEESDEGTHYYAIIHFTDVTGAQRELRGSSGVRQPPAAGTGVRVTYDPESPGNAWIDGSAAPWLIPWLIAVLGIALVVAGAVSWASKMHG
jgi:Protein of unknown function (DUF3592)